jgi:trehalose 6-phosphate phosphatase
MLRAVAATADALLERLVESPDETGLFLDFDGVLAPIVARPEDAAVPPETRSELRRLASRYRLVAVVSGRDGDDVRARVDVDELVYVGSHGLELDPEAARWAERIQEFAKRAPWPAERKRLTVSFHYRQADDQQAAVAELEHVAAQARADGLVARFGRKVLEVLPPLDADKGTAVRTLVERVGIRRGLVAGDDTTDIDAFRAAEQLDVAVRVAVATAESPPALREQAELVVASPAEFLELLRRL